MAEAPSHGGRAAQASHRTARGRRSGVERDPTLSHRVGRPRSSDRAVPVRRTDGCRQDGAGARPRRVPLRRRDARWSGSTCPSTRSGTRSRVWSARLRATSATTKAVSSRKPFDVVPTRSSCSTRSRRRTRTCSTSCLQVMDEGRLTDSKGRTVDFRNAILIMTSNLGSEFLLQETVNEDKVLDVVNQFFRPEFLNRLDEILIFRRLSLGAGSSDRRHPDRPRREAARRAQHHRSMSPWLLEICSDGWATTRRSVRVR